MRETPLSKDDIGRFLDEFGSKLLNSRSTTWRGLSEKERGDAPEVLLLKHPTLMKRPVITGAGATQVGWSAGVKAAVLG